jgi:serine/threonine protein kinase
MLGEFRVLKRLGEGGMGQVYLAEQPRLERQVAIKVLRPMRPSSSSDESDPPMLADAPERFKREAHAVGKLDHPNILPVHDFGLDKELMYLVMPYIAEGSLFDAMRPGSKRQRFSLPLDAAQVAPLVFQAASALQYAHDRNIIHRDVKPENFLIRTERDGTLQVLLADFGLVKEYHPGSGTATMAVGTADYVAPEQIEGRPVPASDQYSLAVMAYEFLTGRLPFTGSVAEVATKHLRQQPPAPRSINSKIPAEIEEVILTAMRKRPEERWPSIMQFARAYSEALKKVEQRRAGERPIEEERTVMLSPHQQAAKPPQAAHTPAAPAQKPPASPQAAAPARPAYPARQVVTPPAYPTPGNSAGAARQPAMPPASAGYQPQAHPPASSAVQQAQRGAAPSWTGAPVDAQPAARRGSSSSMKLIIALVIVVLIVVVVVLGLVAAGIL